MHKRIGDYGIIGNSRTAALFGSDGSIGWLCLPWLDSPSVFAALLDQDKGGRFALCPAESFDSTSRYRPGTNILTTTFRAVAGKVRLTDFMAVDESRAENNDQAQRLYRRVEVAEGEAEIVLSFEPRFDYARAETRLEVFGEGVRARGGERRLHLFVSRPGIEIEGGEARGRWRLGAGEAIWFLLSFGDETPAALHPADAEAALERTERTWHDWLERSETGEDFDFGPFREMVERSSLVLKLLEFAPTGAMAAAATTSLPEEIGGGRNWDYRFSWIRDAALTVQALFNIGHLAEMEKYLKWLEKFICESGSSLQVLYGLRGETDVPEQELPHFSGYKGSRPVRIGNGAYAQKQLDIYGEVMDAALRLSNYAGKIEFSMWPFFRSICDTVCERWGRRTPGSGRCETGLTIWSIPRSCAGSPSTGA